jgi:quercetin dioxygenase-like cupin family protein
MPIPFHNPERRENLFGGNGEVLVESLPGTLCAPFSVALHCELSAGGTVGAHQQETESEIIIGLEGEAVLYIDGVRNAVTPGVVVALPLGACLEIDNASVELPFRYLIIKAHSESKL